jgi:hypothetical protein
MTKRHGKSTGLDAALEVLLGKLDRKNAGAWTSAKVAVLWEEVAGPIVGAHTTGVHLREGVLVVYVDSHARANDMAALSERYRTEMNLGLGKNLISRVSFTVSRKVSEQHRLQVVERETEDFYKEDDVDPIPLTPTELAQVEASASAIHDDELRQAVLRATVKDLEWKKGIAERSSSQGPREGA